MPDIELTGLTKRYDALTAVDALTAHATAGRITAFLGPNGSGKTTTMRMLLGLSEPDSGTALIGGQRYRDLSQPLRVVGAVLDQGFHPNRSARNHLRITAAQAGVAESRADEVLEEVGLTEAGRRRVGGFSLGMRQRLNLAAAMVGRPENLVLDEPLNGLDPAGIQWMRVFLRSFADSGGTVLLSSHLLSEIAHSADDAIIIDHGRLVGAGPVSTLAPASRTIRVTTPDGAILTAALTRAGAEVRPEGDNTVVVANLSLEEIGRVARDSRVLITQMRSQEEDLEAVFAALVERTEATHDHSCAHRAAQAPDHPRRVGRARPHCVPDGGLGVLERVARRHPGEPRRRHGRQHGQGLRHGSRQLQRDAGARDHDRCRGGPTPHDARDLLGEPRRGRVLVAKLVTAGGLGLLYGALTFGLTIAVAVPLYAAKGVHDYPVSIAASVARDDAADRVLRPARRRARGADPEHSGRDHRCARLGVPRRARDPPAPSAFGREMASHRSGNRPDHTGRRRPERISPRAVGGARPRRLGSGRGGPRARSSR